MNKERRAQIAKAEGLINDARAILETVAEDEAEYYENMPAGFKDGEKGDNVQDQLDRLSTIIDDLENMDLSNF